MRKIANILDFPRPSLAPEIWEQGQSLKSAVKQFILDFISSFAQANNLKDTNAWITEVKFVGSLTTNCYNSNSDMDIHIGVDLSKFIEVERPEMSEQEASEYLDEIRKQIDQVKAKVQGTEHATEIYFETKFTNKASQEFSGTYSVLEDKWLKYPHIVDQNFDIEKLHPELLELAKETASELDETFGDIKREIKDIKELDETIQSWPEAQRENFLKKLQKKLEDLETEIEGLVDVREDVAEKRKHYKALSEQEVRFKYLQKYFYMHVLTDLKTLLKQSPDLSMKDIPVVENIMSQSNLKKAKVKIRKCNICGKEFDATRTNALRCPKCYDKQANLKQAGGVLDVNGVRVYKDPTFEQAENLWEASGKIGSRHLRWAISPETNELFIWDAFNAHHTQMMEGLGIEPSKENYEDYAGDIVEFDDLDSVYQQWENKPIIASLKLAYQEDENRLLVDMDDTICHETPEHKLGEPMEGVKEALTKLKGQGFEIVIFSHRADSEKGHEDIKEYLDAHEIPYDSIFQGEKPLARFQIDDRAIHFDNWNSVLKQIEKSDKKASLITAYERHGAYWVDPSGKVYPIKTTHEDWFFENEELLRNQYHYDKDDIGQDWWDIKTGNLLKQLLEDGWLRVGDLFAAGRKSIGTGIEIDNLNSIPSTLVDFVANFGKDKYWQIEDLQRRVVELSVEELVADGQEAVNRALQREQMQSRRPVAAALDLPVIDPKTLNRTEPYALFIGTQMFSKKEGLDLFDVFGQHPMITEHNRVPTVTLDTLIKENIPVIGKEPKAGDKQPFQDISGVVKLASKKIASFSDPIWIDPKGKIYKITNSSHEDWALENQDFLEKKYNIHWVSSYATKDLLDNGWIRIGDIGVGESGFGIEMFDLAKIPSFVFDYIFSNLQQNDMVAMADEQNRFIELPVKDMTHGQKDINRELFLNRTAQLGSEYDFSSTQFNIPKELSEKIIRWAVENIPEDQIIHDEKDPGTKGIQLESHITLKYGLKTDNFEEVEKALEGEKAPHIKFGKTSFFEPKGKDYDVVIIKVESEDLQKLNEKLCSQVEHEDTQGKEYHPHVTVAYVQRGKGKDFDGKDIITGEELDLEVLTFSPKEGEKRELELGKVTEKVASALPGTGYWILPDGTIIELDETHMGWVTSHMDDLKKDFKIKSADPLEAYDELLYKGWTRVTADEERDGYGIEVFDLKNVPTGVDNFVMKYPPTKEDGIIIEDRKDAVVVQDPFPSLQKSVNKALQQKRLQTQSSFMPSNTDLAPSDDWAGTVGYPTNESMDAPQNVSDESTWYSPENDRPRSTNFLKRMLSLFQKPLSKKEEPKNIVPVKEATNKQASPHGYGGWISPTGEVILAKDHGWAILEDPKTFGFDKPIDKDHVRWQYVYESLYNKGWLQFRIWGNDLHFSGSNLESMKKAENIIFNELDSVSEISLNLNDGNYTATTEEFKEKGFDAFSKHVSMIAKQWATPKEPINQPGMDWQWADEIYQYVDENWQDWLVGWMNLNPKNYVKPVILIEKIYEDEGAVSAWVHVEFVNLAGNSDAYMKLVISADIEGEESIEPEGREFSQHLTNWEIDVKDYGLQDSLEKDSSYGPTNYQGPSVADHGYQNSAWDDMNVTLSDEEDEELMDQNGSGGWPNRWMSRHRGPYYTNEGKVVKMLEDTKPQKQAASGNTSLWLSPNGKEYPVFPSHSGWIYNNFELLEKKYKIPKGDFGGKDDISLNDILIGKGWVRVDGILPNEIDLQLADIHNIPQVAEQFVWKHKPEVVIIEDLKGEDISFDEEEYSKGLMKKASISGEVTNHILNLIHQNGGATWNMSKGNLVGQPYFAVAIYPEKEQIVPEADFENLEEYIVNNEGLLNNPDNSFGAWVSGGKTYYDIVSTLTDKNEAIKLGQQHKQLAIFDLKTLTEIPIQKVAKLAAAVSDREQQKYYDEIYSDRWRDDSDKIDGGNEYYDWSELGSNDYPNPKDEEKEHVYMDQLEDPAKANFPAGLPEYWVTFYDSNPDQGDQGGI